MSIRADRPRNAAFNKERARVEYAQRRLTELRAQGMADSAAWEAIGSEIKGGAVDDCGCSRATAMCAINQECRVRRSANTEKS